jgi:hypothetical protein
MHEREETKRRVATPISRNNTNPEIDPKDLSY